MCGPRVIARLSRSIDSVAIRALCPVVRSIGGFDAALSKLDVSQKTTAICVVDTEGRRVWRGTAPTDPCQISLLAYKHAGADAKLERRASNPTHIRRP